MSASGSGPPYPNPAAFPGALTSCCMSDTYLCMRTTLDIDDRILAAAKRRARERGTTLTAVVEEALAAALAGRPAGARRYKLKWRTHRGRLLPGVDVADRDSLRDAMHGRL